MRFFSSQISRSRAGGFSCCVIAILFLSCRMPKPGGRDTANRQFSRSRCSHFRWSIPSCMQPHSQCFTTPTAFCARAALAPIEVAFYAPRRIKARAPRAERIEDDELGSGAEPIRVAYPISRTPDAAPRAEADDDSDQEQAEPQIESRGDRPTVAGSRAVVRNGIAYAPSRAPQNVKNAIWAANTLRRKPYVWGGGHGSFND